jgi:hypothetical protein
MFHARPSFAGRAWKSSPAALGLARRPPRSTDDLNGIVQVERGARAFDHGSERERKANRRGGPDEHVFEVSGELVVGTMRDDLAAEQILVDDFCVRRLARNGGDEGDRPKLAYVGMMAGRMHRGGKGARGAAHHARCDFARAG